MADRDQVTELGRLLGAVATQHHEETGGHGDHWAEWYASRLVGKIGSFVGFDPTAEQILGWLRRADEKYREEEPETRWPFFYAELILDSMALEPWPPGAPVDGSLDQ